MAKMTLEKLAQMMNGGFKELYQRIDGIDARMGRLEGEVKELRSDVSNWRSIINGHEARIELLERKTGIS